MLDIINKLFYIIPSGKRLSLFLIFVGMLTGSILDVISIGSIPLFVSIVTNPEKVFLNQSYSNVFDFFGIDSQEKLVLAGVLFLITVLSLKFFYFFLFNKFSTAFIYRTYKEISRKLFHKYMNAPYTFILRRNTAEMIRSISADINHVIEQVMLPLLRILMELLLIATTVSLLFIVEPLVTAIVLVLIGTISVSLSYIIKNKTKDFGRLAINERKNIITVINEGLGGLKDIKVLTREKWFEKKLSQSVNEFSKSQSYILFINSMTKYVLEILLVKTMLLISLILYFGGRSIDSVVPILSLFAAATVRLMPAVQTIINYLNLFRYYKHTVNPIYEDLKTLEFDIGYGEPADEDEGKRLLLKNSIVLDRINFTYPGIKTPVIIDVSLKIKKNSVVGFVGPTGSGKTTLIDLILGLLYPDSGSIWIDNADLKQNIRQWRRNIGYVPQHIYLTDNTIMRNIALGYPEEEIDKQKIISAVKAAQLEKFIVELPEGLKTKVGERGIRLSGGQRQRIGIARALYNEPEVLILDEATSSLDNETEKYVIEEINKLRGNRTIIIIAHRLSTLQNCDEIFTLRKGRLVKTE